MKKLVGAIFLFMSFVGQVVANENWTGEINWINVNEQGAAFIFINNPRSGPKPSLTCGQHNIVHLGTKNQPVNAAFLSQALMVYASERTIRFGVRGTGDSCETSYISAR